MWRELGEDLNDAQTLESWIRVFDRVEQNEMPPEDADVPSKESRDTFVRHLKPPLVRAHVDSKPTMLRRLNRREYENTLNDLFGVRLDLAATLPEDGRFHEFDNVGQSLGISLVHLEKYLDAIDTVLDAAIAKDVHAPTSKTRRVSYADTSEGDRFIGKLWGKLDDGSVVFYANLGYPTGMLRGTGAPSKGKYRIRITGHAYRSEDPITLRLGGTSFARGSDKPTFGYFSLEPGEAQTIELETWMNEREMIEITPWGLDTGSYNLRNQGLDDYRGPGLAIKYVEVEGPIVDEFPSRGHRLLFDGIDRREVPPSNPNQRSKSWYVPKFEIRSEQPLADAHQVLNRVAGMAFRHPVTESAIAPYLSLFESELEAGHSFETALRTAVAAIFCSPDFLYFQEAPGPLNDHALATRLSYFLFRSAPDKHLRELADQQAFVHSPDELMHQAERLLQSPLSDRFVNDFCDAWLNLRDLQFTNPDQKLFPEFDAYLLHSMEIETRSFIRRMIQENLPIGDLIRPDFAMLNERLAKHYDIEGVDGPTVAPIPQDRSSVRGGLLGQAAVLKVSANGTNTSPVVRGVWVTERLLGITPQPPPPGIPGVEPDIRGSSTLRELLDKHRDQDSCRNCHAQIDAPGFALERFNPIGGWRDRYRSLGQGDKVNLQINRRRVQYRLGPPVDASGTTHDGRPFEDFLDFRDGLATQEDLLARTLTKKLLTFATGRAIGFSDRQEVEQIVQRSRAKGHRFRDLIQSVVTSDIFRTK